MEILSQVAEGIQAVLIETADMIGREVGFIKRLKKLSGSRFMQILVFGWLNNPNSIVEELCQTAATLDIEIGRSMRNRRSRSLRLFLGKLPCGVP